MKYLMIMAAVSLGFWACKTSDNQVTQANIDLVNAYIASVENMDFDGMDKYLADDYMGIGPSYGDTIRKAEAIENWKANVANLYEKIHYNRSRCVAATIKDGDNTGNWVGNWAELNIVYKNNMGSVTIWANTNYLVENGKILRSISFYNEADALRQLGYKIVPPDPVQ